MALWLFRRKSRRKRARSSTQPGDDVQRPVPRSQTEPESTAAMPGRQLSVKKQRVESTKLQRRARTYSFDTGRRDSLYINQKKGNRRTRESVPPVPALAGANPARGNYDDEKHSGDRSEPEDNVFERIPTLHAAKRDGEHLRQRKSSKRRKNSHDREREAELKAMSNFVPVRPATDAWTSGRPMKRDTKRARTGLGLGFGSASKADWDKEHSSEISLPTSGSVHSSMSSGSEQIAYKVSTFDSLAPKPTLRYALFPRWGPPSGGTMPQRATSQRRRLSEKEPIPEATLKAHKRIHDLADDLSASDLRELMERDNRRRERKREKEQDKVNRRLARRAEKQRSAAEQGIPNLERGIIGREVGLGLDPVSAVVTSSTRRDSDAATEQEEAKPEVKSGEEPAKTLTPSPRSAFHRTTSIPLEVTTPSKRLEEAASPSPHVQSPKRRGFLRSKKSRSKSPLLADQEKSQVPETQHKVSESSSSRGPSWTSFFRWGTKNKRTSGPSSFSNTSRDSMGTQPQSSTAPTAPVTTFTPTRSVGAGFPRRTLSRFREDLPDFLMSPPDSRAQTPEPDPVPAIAEQDSPQPDTIADTAHQAEAERYDTPTSGRRSFEGDDVRRTPTSWVQREGVGPSPEPQHSMSMASIDSEASWLSGRVGNRSRTSQIRQQRSPQRQPTIGGSDEAGGSQEYGLPEEEVGDLADDEYLGRIAKRHSVRTKNRKSTGEARPSSDEEDARYGAVGGRKPFVVTGHNLKSREGLLNTRDDDSEMGDVDSPTSPLSYDAKEEEAGLQRATSVKLSQGHARHISAGSAKLLELSPRTSVDTKRRSLEPRGL